MSKDHATSSYVCYGIMTKQHTEQQWDAMFPYTVQLYLGEQLVLSEVIRIMELRYNFRATQSMYKKRISRWQLHKYKKRDPDHQNTLSTATAGSLIPPTRIEFESTNGQSRVLLPKTGNVAHQHSSLSPQLSNSFSDRTALSVFFHIKDLTVLNSKSRGMLAPLMPPSDDQTIFVASNIKEGTQMYVTLALASSLTTRGEGFLAGKALRKAFLMIEGVIRGSHFGLEWALLDICYDLVQRGQNELFVALTMHIANLARLLLPDSHPLARLVEQIVSYDGDVATLLQRAYFYQTSAIQQDQDVRDFIIDQNRNAHEHLIRDNKLPGVGDDALAQVIRGIKAVHFEVEDQKGPPASTSSRTSKHDPSAPSLREFIQIRTRRSLELTKTKPDALFVSVSDRVLLSESNPMIAPMYKLKAQAFQQIYDWDLEGAAETQNKLLEFMKDVVYTDCWGIIRELWAFERILLKLDRKEEAEIVAKEARERAVAFLKDIPDDEV